MIGFRDFIKEAIHKNVVTSVDPNMPPLSKGPLDQINRTAEDFKRMAAERRAAHASAPAPAPAAGPKSTMRHMGHALKTMSLRRKILLGAGAVAIPAGAVVAGSAYAQHRNSR
jgi:hypothetical protein